MNRREFIHAGTLAALVSQGQLPVLAAEKKRKRVGGAASSDNIFTEPCAIEPVTGYLPRFDPAAKGGMAGDFNAKYTLVATRSSKGNKSNNTVTGTVDVSFSGIVCRTVEKRRTGPDSFVDCEIKCDGAVNAVSSWTLKSSIGGVKGTTFTEKGEWNGSEMVVTAKDWVQRRATTNPLIGRWALLPLLASGRLKKRPLVFDMLDDSTLRPGQELRYEGQVEIPVSQGKVELHSYVQTGQCIVPTHYLVDPEGRVQLITGSQVSWALSGLSPV